MSNRRREFITLFGGAAAAWPLAARAQQLERMRRIGVLMGIANDALGRERVKAFAQGLQELGWVPGRNTQIDFVWAGGAGDIQLYAQELVRSAPDVLLATSTTTTIALRQETSTIPIVFVTVSDPIGSGLVASLARPGGNTTGLAGSSDDSAPKQLELLATAVPKLSRVAILTNPHNPNSPAVMRSAQSAAEKVGLLVMPVQARNPQEIEDAFAVLAKQNVTAVMVANDAVFFVQRQQLAQLALGNRVASIFPVREYAAAGGLMSYGESLREFYRRAASFVDKIFKGAKPGDLPIEQPTRFNLVINRKTADALGLHDSTATLHFRRRGDRVKRREFITLLGGAAAWPLVASAQQPTMPVIGFLSGASLSFCGRRGRCGRRG